MKKTLASLVLAHLCLVTLSNAAGLSLNGDWHYIVDPQLIGCKGYHDSPDSTKDNMLFGRNRRPKNRSDLVEFNFAASPTLKVPGDWNTQKPELFYYEGTVWYQRSFEFRVSSFESQVSGSESQVSGSESGNAKLRYFLHFDAVSLEAHVYLNGKKLGSHVGGFTPFEFEVTDVLKDGENSVVVRADNTRHKSGIPTHGFDWWNYGGIIRDVRIEARPQTYVSQWRAFLDNDDAGLIHAEVKLDKPVKDVEVTFAIPELGISEKTVTDENGCSSFAIRNSSLSLWSPSNPKLYGVTVTAGEDAVVDEMGFRTIAAKGRKILLNGEEIYLKGVCLHDEAPNGGGRVTTDSDVAENIRRAKEAGANFVRLAHYPHNEKMVRACEREGLLVWSEIPLYWMIDWKNPATYESAASQAREMILRDIRRANIIIWSLANETVQSKERTAFLTRLAEYARSLDSTRLISLAMEVTSAKNCVNRLDDDLNTVVDIVAFNEYIGWYRNVNDADKMVWEIPYDKPVVISEFGGGALAGRHGERDERWTEEMQQNIYEANFRMFSRIDGLCGICPWVLTDFRSPRRPLAGVQDGYNRKGLFSPDGRRKLALESLRRYYETK